MDRHRDKSPANTTGGERNNDSEPVTISWPIRRLRRSGPQEALDDLVVAERRLELVLNGEPLLAMLALPRDIEALALGFLVSEGLWGRRDTMPDIHFDSAAARIECAGDFDQDAVETVHRRWTFGTGCGGGGTARDPSRLSQCRPIDSQLTIRAPDLAALGRAFGKRGELYLSTGGVHACAVAESDRIILFAEDVGRHNAFDKIAGLALMQGIDLAQKVVLTSGRLSAEIVSKAIAHRVPLLASISAPTAMGVRWARRFGLTLVGFLRAGRMNVYTGYQRVLPADA
jgi:FdhD protein